MNKPRQPGHSKTTVICGQLLDGTGRDPVKNAVVSVSGDRISGITSGGGAKSAGQTLDFSGYTVMPGFVDSHDHLDLDADSETLGSIDHEEIAWGAMRAVKNAKLMLESGITTLRNVGSKNPIDMCVKRAIEEGWIVGPRIVVSGFAIGRTFGHGRALQIDADGVDEVLKAVRKQLRYGADVIKIFPSSGTAEMNAISVTGRIEPLPKDKDPMWAEMTEEEIITAVTEAHRSGTRVAAHAHGGIGATWSIKAGVDSIEHGRYLTDEQLAMMKDRGTYLVITSSVAVPLAFTDLYPEATRQRALDGLKNRKAWVERVRASGVKVAVGCDVAHGMMLLEMAVMVWGGYSPMEAIVAATRSGADLCGRLHEVGTIETGKYADMVVLDADPLTSFKPLVWGPGEIDTGLKVKAVVKGGVLVFDARN